MYNTRNIVANLKDEIYMHKLHLENKGMKHVMTDRDFFYHRRCAEQKITHLTFADDLLLFCKGNTESISLLLDAVRCFLMQLNCFLTFLDFIQVPLSALVFLVMWRWRLNLLPWAFLGLSKVLCRLLIWESLLSLEISRLVTVSLWSLEFVTVLKHGLPISLAKLVDYSLLTRFYLLFTASGQGVCSSPLVLSNLSRAFWFVSCGRGTFLADAWLKWLGRIVVFQRSKGALALKNFRFGTMLQFYISFGESLTGMTLFGLSGCITTI